MAEYPLAPWVGQPANPSANYATGFQLGVHLGAQQAAHAFQAQQMAQQQQRIAMEAQKQELDNAYQAQLLNLKVGEMARQHQAQQMFSTRVAMGEDPSRVLMELAPALGESPSAILRDQRLRDQARESMAFRNANMQRLIAGQQAREQRSDLTAQLAREREDRVAAQAKERLDLEKQSIADRKSLAAQRARQTAEKALLQDPAYLKLQADLNTSTRLLNERIAKGRGMFGLGDKKTLDSEVDALTKRVANSEKAIKDYRDRVITSTPPAAFVNPVQNETTEEDQGVGDDDMPDVSVKRVKVRSPEGKTGTLPENQIEEAIKAGYTRI